MTKSSLVAKYVAIQMPYVALSTSPVAQLYTVVEFVHVHILFNFALHWKQMARLTWLKENLHDLIQKPWKINQLYQNISYKSTIIEVKYKFVGACGFTNRSCDLTQESLLYIQNGQSRSWSAVHKL